MSRLTFTLRPFTLETLRPSARISRPRERKGSPSNKPSRSSMAETCSRQAAGISNSASSIARSSPWRTRLPSTFPPTSAIMASRMMDLPAPVSPVKINSPLSRVSSSLWMIAKFSMRSSVSIPSPLNADAFQAVKNSAGCQDGVNGRPKQIQQPSSGVDIEIYQGKQRVRHWHNQPADQRGRHCDNGYRF